MRALAFASLPIIVVLACTGGDGGGGAPIDAGPDAGAIPNVSADPCPPPPSGACDPAFPVAPPSMPDTAFCARAAGDRGDDTVTAIQVADGNILVAGLAEGAFDLGGGPVVGKQLERAVESFVASYDATCAMRWAKRFAGTVDVLFDRSGGALVVGDVGSTTWFDAAGATRLTASLVQPGVQPGRRDAFAVDPTGGIAVSTPDWSEPQPANQPPNHHSGVVARYAPLGALVWRRASGAGKPAIDATGNVFVLDSTTTNVVRKLDAATGASVWCAPIPADVTSIAMEGADRLVLVSARGASVGVRVLAESGCLLSERALVLPAPMKLDNMYDDAFLYRNATTGTVVTTPWGDVHVATADSKIRTATFDASGALTATGTYGRATQHPAPSIAVGASGEIAVGGGFASVDLALGGKTLANTYAWTTDLFIARNPPRADLSADPPAPPTFPAPTTMAVTRPFGLATNGTAVYWATSDFPNSTLMRCASTGCASGEPKELARLGSFRAIAAAPSGVFASAYDAMHGVLVRCPGDVCAVDALTFDPQAFALGASAMGLALHGSDFYHFDVEACPFGGCAASTRVMTEQSSPFATDYGVFFTPGPVQLGVKSCPITGCGTTPPPGTEWITLALTPDVAPDATHLFTHQGDRVESCALPDCAAGPALFAPGLGDVAYGFASSASPRIVTDGTSVYFFAGLTPPWFRPSGTVRLLRCPVAGCPASGPDILWTSPPWDTTALDIRPLSLAVDGARLYFSARQSDGSFVLATVPK